MICETRNVARANYALKKWRMARTISKYRTYFRAKKHVCGTDRFCAIGRLVAQRLKVFGSRILIYDPFVAKEEIEALGYEAVDKDTLLKESDIVILAWTYRTQ